MTEVLKHLSSPLVATAVVATGLQAGTYYTWASGVMPGLARVNDRTFVNAFQQMNIAIVNPVFMASFFGAPALAVATAVVTRGPARPLVIAGAALAMATLVITAAGNIPLNNALDRAGPVDKIIDVAGLRQSFEKPWVRLNIMRAVTSTASLAALAWAAVRM